MEKHIQEIQELRERVIELENTQERIFAQHISLIGAKTSVVEIVAKVVAEEFGLNPFVFSNFQAYRIQIGKANNKSKIKLDDKENITQAFFICSILHHWFQVYIVVINQLLLVPTILRTEVPTFTIDALVQDGTEEQKKIRARYYQY